MLFKLGKPLVMVCVGGDFLLPTWLLFPSETTASYCATFFYIFHFLARFFFLSLIFRVDRAIKMLLLLLRLFVWRVLASHLAAPTHRGRSPPPPPPVNHPHTHTHTHILTYWLYSPTRYLLLCLPWRLSFSLWYFYYYYFSRNSLFCSAVSLEKFNFYFFFSFFVLFYLPPSSFSSMPSTGCVCVLSIFMIIFCYSAPLFCSWNLAFTLPFPPFRSESINLCYFLFILFTPSFSALYSSISISKVKHTHWAWVRWSDVGEMGATERARRSFIHFHAFYYAERMCALVCVAVSVRVFVCKRG